MTWQNITYNLPNVPANCLRYDIGSDTANYDMYVGTDVGVFYKKELDTVWQYYGMGMPNTQVSDLEIFYPTGKLRAATYGRGIWETNLVRPVAPADVAHVASPRFTMQLQENPVREGLQLNLVWETQTHWAMRILDAGGRVVKQDQGQHGTGASIYRCSVNELPAGNYYIEVRSNQGIRRLPFTKL